MIQGGEMIATETAETFLCPKCDTKKPASEFYTHRSNRSGRQAYCKKCQSDYVKTGYRTDEGFREKRKRARKKFVLANPDKIKLYDKRKSLKRLCNITYEEFESTVAKQGGLCAIKGCGRPAKVADHCHDTLVFRGVLCNQCNLALGQIDESVNRLNGMIDYILDI